MMQVLVSTRGQAGLDRLATHCLPVVTEMQWLVSCQRGNDKSVTIPAALAERHDIRIYLTDSHGLSANRNNALSLATAPYALIADDDLDFYQEGLEKIMGIFKSCPDIDVLTFRHTGPSLRHYPSHGQDIMTLIRNYHVCSVEMAFKRTALTDRNIRFSLLAGIGAPYLPQGEEELLLDDCRKAGLKGMFADVAVAHHAGVSSGHRNFNAGSMRSRGAVLWHRHRLMGVVRIPRVAWQLRYKVNFAKGIIWLSQGTLYALRHGL